MPSKKQLDNNNNISSFLPILGGYYSDGALNSTGTRAFWWGSEEVASYKRNALRYNGTTLVTGDGVYYRDLGFYIRCVSEEKTVLDLTYMQDMTPAAVPFLSFSGWRYYYKKLARISGRSGCRYHQDDRHWRSCQDLYY